MAQYIDKDAVVAEIEKLRKNACESFQKGNSTEEQYYIRYGVIQDILSFLVTLEVEDAIDALRTEYEKGRADVIADTLSWLENCWPRYCSNHTIIEGYKEAIKYD